MCVFDVLSFVPIGAVLFVFVYGCVYMYVNRSI